MSYAMGTYAMTPPGPPVSVLGGSALPVSVLRVVLADDARLFRVALAELLEGHGCEIVAQVGDADGLRAAVDLTCPDLAVIDIRMPPTHRLDGLVAALHIRRTHPEVGVLLLSQHLEAAHLVELVGDRAGGSSLSSWNRSSSPWSPIGCRRRRCRSWQPASG